MAYSKVSIIGLGYIGLPTATILASRHIHVVGVDINENTVKAVNSGQAPIVEPGLEALLQEVTRTGHLRAASQAEPAEAFIIAVPTPLTAEHKPDLGFVRLAAQSIAPVLTKGNLVILESTSPVGTTERLAAQLAEARPDLAFPQPGATRADIDIAYCPERILPGQMLAELVSNDRVVGGLTPRASQAAAGLYKSFVRGRIATTSVRMAEMCKLTENAFRNVNIAFANELSLICDRQGLDVWELITLANRHPRVNILRPGPGVGGHCIAVDPWFIVDSAPEDARLIRTACEINDHKPKWVLGKIKEAIADALAADPGKTMSEITVACLGLAFKPNIDDLRESPAVSITRSLAALGCRVMTVEPHISALPPQLRLANVRLASFEEALESSQAICLLVGHSCFVLSLPDLRRHEHIVDAVGLLSQNTLVRP
jgi:UDP-N-acetyl-D-mannosaminuronic acid dehydrogenase